VKCWKVRKKGTILYSCGGSMPSFTKRGVTWFRYCDFLKHFKGLHKATRDMYVRDCELVEYEVSELVVKSLLVEAGLLEL
jgi:transposase-like protein